MSCPPPSLLKPRPHAQLTGAWPFALCLRLSVPWKGETPLLLYIITLFLPCITFFFNIYNSYFCFVNRFFCIIFLDSMYK